MDSLQTELSNVDISINFDDFRVRCSAINKILSESTQNPSLTEKQAVFLAELENKDKITDKQKEEMVRLQMLRENATKVVLSDICIDYLMEAYSWITKGKISVNKESMDILATKKGTLVENDSIELLSIVDSIPYQKNEVRVSNKFLTGEPDIFTGTEIMQAETITDIKSLWDYPLFLKSLNKKPEKGYIQQIQGYCDITGARVGQAAKCLVNTPSEMIEDIKYKIAKKFGAITVEAPDFLKEWEMWERSMLFDDIDVDQRVFKLPVEPFTDFEQKKVYDRVKICRDWLNTFHENYQKLNK